MNIEDQLRDAAKAVESSSPFHVEQVMYDEQAFGNKYVLLRYKRILKLSFVEDRGVFSCDVEHRRESYPADDVFQVIGIPCIPKSGSFITMMSEVFSIIMSNLDKILEAFDSKHYRDTRRTLDGIAAKRVSDQLRDAAKAIESSSPFHVEQVMYDEQAFGNKYVLLRYKRILKISFVEDRGVLSCDVEHGRESYSADDVFQVIGIPCIPNSGRFITMMTEVFSVFLSNLDKILEAFDSKHYKATRKRLDAIAAKRVSELFNIHRN